LIPRTVTALWPGGAGQPGIPLQFETQFDFIAARRGGIPVFKSATNRTSPETGRQLAGRDFPAWSGRGG